MSDEIDNVLHRMLIHALQVLLLYRFLNILYIHLRDDAEHRRFKRLLHVFDRAQRGVERLHDKRDDQAENKPDDNAHGTRRYGSGWVDRTRGKKGGLDDVHLFRFLGPLDESFLILSLQKGRHVCVQFHFPLQAIELELLVEHELRLLV